MSASLRTGRLGLGPDSPCLRREAPAHPGRCRCPSARPAQALESASSQAEGGERRDRTPLFQSIESINLEGQPSATTFREAQADARHDAVLQASLGSESMARTMSGAAESRASGDGVSPRGLRPARMLLPERLTHGLRTRRPRCRLILAPRGSFHVAQFSVALKGQPQISSSLSPRKGNHKSAVLCRPERATTNQPGATPRGPSQRIRPSPVRRNSAGATRPAFSGLILLVFRGNSRSQGVALG